MFKGEVLTEQIRFAGRPSLDLTVIPSGPGGHVYATLWTDSGKRLGWGQIDLRFPEGEETARVVVPGQDLKVTLSFQPLDAVVEPGDRITLRIGQGYYGDHLPSVPTFPMGLRLGKGATTLRIDTFARDGSTYFTPPPVPES